MKKVLLFKILSLFVCFYCQNAFSQYSGKVVGVKDGDSIEILMNDNRILEVRLEHVDCPEIGSGQPYSRVAKKFSSDLCFGKVVKVEGSGNFDRYGRYIAEVIVSDTIVLNKKLVETGLAWHYKRYSQSEEYADIEIAARAAKRNIWRDPKATPPWEWRKK